MREKFKKLLEENGLRVVKCPSGKRNVPDHYYAVKLSEVLGKGNFGVVYKAYRVDPKTGQLITEDYIDPRTGEKPVRPYAVKIFKNAEQYDEKEAEYLRNYIYVENPVEDKGEKLLFCEYIPGENITEENDDMIVLAENVKNMTFAERVNLLATIALSVNLIHHYTPSTGNALIHADLKGSNMRMSVDKANKKVDTTVSDFGLAEEVSDDSSQQNYSKLRGMVVLNPPEVQLGRRGLKSDIYALVPLFATILGAKYVMGNKMRFTEIDENIMRVIPGENMQKYTEAGFKIDDMFQGFIIPDYLIDVKKYIYALFMRMQHNDYVKRCDSDDLLKFLNTLNQFCKIIDANPSACNKEDYVVIETKLALIAAGLWQERIATLQEVEPLSGIPLSELTAIKFMEYDLDGHLDVCAKIIELSKKDSLDYEHALKLFPGNPLFAEFIEKQEQEKQKILLTKSANSVPVQSGYVDSAASVGGLRAAAAPHQPIVHSEKLKKGKWK